MRASHKKWHYCYNINLRYGEAILYNGWHFYLRYVDSSDASVPVRPTLRDGRCPLGGTGLVLGEGYTSACGAFGVNDKLSSAASSSVTVGDGGRSACAGAGAGGSKLGSGSSRGDVGAGDPASNEGGASSYERTNVGVGDGARCGCTRVGAGGDDGPD